MEFFYFLIKSTVLGTGILFKFRQTHMTEGVVKLQDNSVTSYTGRDTEITASY